MSTNEESGSSKPGIRQVAKEMVKDGAELVKKASKCGARKAIPAAKRAIGKGVVNKTASAGVITSVAYGICTGDVTGSAAGVGASIGVRGRKRVVGVAKSLWKGIKWVWKESADHAEDSEVDNPEPPQKKTPVMTGVGGLFAASLVGPKEEERLEEVRMKWLEQQPLTQDEKIMLAMSEDR